MTTIYLAQLLRIALSNIGWTYSPVHTYPPNEYGKLVNHLRQAGYDWDTELTITQSGTLCILDACAETIKQRDETARATQAQAAAKQAEAQAKQAEAQAKQAEADAQRAKAEALEMKVRAEYGKMCCDSLIPVAMITVVMIFIMQAISYGVC